MIRLTNEMFASGQPFAQGEVLIWAKKHAPKAVLKGLAALKLSLLTVTGNHYIVGHSETGHHHVLEVLDRPASVPFSEAAQILIDAANDSLVEMRLARDCVLRHLREGDTHESVVLPPGEYIRGVREEQTVEGWRRTQD